MSGQYVCPECGFVGGYDEFDHKAGCGLMCLPCYEKWLDGNLSGGGSDSNELLRLLQADKERFEREIEQLLEQPDFVDHKEKYAQLVVQLIGVNEQIKEAHSGSI